MLTLLEARTQIRRSILNDIQDENGAYNWSDLQLRDAIHAAVAAFASHTAVATATSYPSSGSDYTLPDNLFDTDDLESVGDVFIVQSSELTYLLPISEDEVDPLDTRTYFYTFPRNVLHLTQAPAAGSTVNVRYYAYYNPPYGDSDLLGIPRWAEIAVMYLAAAHVLSASSVTTANIRQYVAQQDRGSPNENPLKEMQRHFMYLYEQELQRVPLQNRVKRYARNS